MIHNAVIHLNGEQPLVADLFDMPGPGDVALRCTNLRQLNGKRPVFTDAIDSVFIIPYVHIRFVEVPPSSIANDGDVPLPIGAGVAAGHGSAIHPDQEAELDLEIDEDFLRRIREV